MHGVGIGHDRMLGDAGLPGKPVAINCAIAMQEAGMDEDISNKSKAHEVGIVVDTMSVEELTERIALLEGEIMRLRAAINAREKTLQVAESIFKF
ncbi:MAG: DUF1192 domain-containing protein [Candidatus Devosia symbiotica]|nr:DUF1192 domain-containing protein [Candidatus Devosia symbiotica]